MGNAIPNRNCLACQTEFSVPAKCPGKLYCSSRCMKREWQRKKRGYKAPTVRPCKICSNSFLPPPFQPKAQTCSRKCCKRLEYLTHKSHCIAQARKWARNNPERVRQIQKKTQAKKPDLYRRIWQVKQQRRDARMRNAPGAGVSAIQWTGVIANQKNRCWWCGKEMDRPTMDHVVPIVRGGAHDVSNIVAACKPCNSKKHAKLWPIESGVLHSATSPVVG